MKVLLIAASSESSLSDTMPDRYKSLSLGHYPPLGLMYLTAYLTKNSNHTAEIIDMEMEGSTGGDVLNIIKAKKPDVAGFYTTSLNINKVFGIVQLIKNYDKNIVTVLGGPHIDLFQQESAALDGVDYAVSGEGEITFTELLNCIEKKGDLSMVKGTAYKDGGTVKVNQKTPLIEDLDSLPHPDRSLTNYKKYYSLIGKNKISTTIMTSRGCPYRCNFCFIQYGGKYRSRSVANVLSEIDECVKIGIKEYFIFDEIFTLNKTRVMEFCDALIKHNYGITFDVRSRIDTMDKDMLEALKAAGCARIQYGIESGTDEILKAMNKGITVQKAREVVRLTKKTGIEVLIDFMIGYPGENKEQINKTIAFAKELNPEYVQFGIVTYFPGIKIYNDALKSGTLKEDFWKKMAINPPEKIVPPFASDIFTRGELEKFLHDAYIKYYFRPGYILMMLFKMPNPVQFMRQIQAGYHLLTGK